MRFVCGFSPNGISFGHADITVQLFREDDYQVPRLMSFELKDVTEFLIKFERYKMGIEESRKTCSQVNDSVKMIFCVDQDLIRVRSQNAGRAKLDNAVRSQKAGQARDVDPTRRFPSPTSPPLPHRKKDQ